MNDVTATRSAAVAFKEERRAMREGHAFLEEKCLLLAAAMLRDLDRYDRAAHTLGRLRGDAAAALVAALRRHGLEGLQCFPALASGAVRVVVRARSLLGVALRDAGTEPISLAAPASVTPSPEAEDCRRKFAALTEHLVELAAISGNLERLHREYRRSVRRTRAMQDVILPELDATISEIETRLEELEQDEALYIRLRR